MAEAQVPWPFSCSLAGLFYSRQEFYHLDFARGYQDGGNTLCRYPLVVNQPFSFCDSEMAFFRMAGPFFGPSVKTPLSFQVQDDIAIIVPRERGIPLGWVGGFSGEAKAAKNPVRGVSV